MDCMGFVAKAKYVRFSPYKLRPIADVIRGKSVEYALRWFSVYRVKKMVPVKKVLESAVANAQDQAQLDASALIITEVRIDQGPIVRYFKPGAMGRANVQRKRMSHISIVVDVSK
jgi:large subunit ribosomal protein L22